MERVARLLGQTDCQRLLGRSRRLAYAMNRFVTLDAYFGTEQMLSGYRVKTWVIVWWHGTTTSIQVGNVNALISKTFALKSVITPLWQNNLLPRYGT